MSEDKCINLILQNQNFIGAAIGPFVAVILAAVGYWLKGILDRNKERKEYLRIIETVTTMSLNDIINIREQLNVFSKNIRQVVKKIKENSADSFSLDRINFPTIVRAYRYENIANIKTRSYYLHNKTLFADAYIKNINQTITDLKNDFEGLIKQNETIISLMKDQTNYQSQRLMYSTNLYNFSLAVDEFLKNNLPKVIETMNQTKVYNSKLRKKYGFLFLWKHEGESFKYFCNSKEKDKFLRNINSLRRIDKLIQKEVEIAICDAESQLIHKKNIKK